MMIIIKLMEYILSRSLGRISHYTADRKK